MFISFFRGIGQYFDGVLVLLHRWSQRRELRYSHEGETSILICTITIVLLLLLRCIVLYEYLAMKWLAMPRHDWKSTG